jgi:hypothetical protein
MDVAQMTLQLATKTPVRVTVSLATTMNSLRKAKEATSHIQTGHCLQHKLGKAEARRRLEAGLGSVRGQFSALLNIQEEVWSGDSLAFRARPLGQQTLHPSRTRALLVLVPVSAMGKRYASASLGDEVDVVARQAEGIHAD